MAVYIIRYGRCLRTIAFTFFCITLFSCNEFYPPIDPGVDRPFIPPATERVLLLTASSDYSSIVYFSSSGIAEAEDYLLHKYIAGPFGGQYQSKMVKGNFFYDVEVHPGAHYKYVLETAQEINGKKIFSDTVSVYTHPLGDNPLAYPSATLSGGVFDLPYQETEGFYLSYPRLPHLLDSLFTKVIPSGANIMFLIDATSSMVEENRVIGQELVHRAAQLLPHHKLAIAYFNYHETKISSVEASPSDIASFFENMVYLDEQHLPTEDYLTPIYTILIDPIWNTPKESVVFVFGDAPSIDLGYGFHWKLIDLCQKRENRTHLYTFTLQHY